jgi:hypothetical protein
VSSFDGALAVPVDVEHLPDRRYRLWLGEPYPRTDLGVVDRTHELGPESRLRVARELQLNIEGEEFYVELRNPRPDYVRIGDRVVARAEDTEACDGTVVGWIQGGVLVHEAGNGHGIYAPEEVTFPEEPSGPDELT